MQRCELLTRTAWVESKKINEKGLKNIWHRKSHPSSHVHKGSPGGINSHGGKNEWNI